MLNKSERKSVLRVIGHCCTFGFLPVKVDQTKWELLPRAEENKYHFWFLLFVLNALYKIGSLAHTYFLKEGAPLHQTVIHVVLSLASPVYIYWYYVLYIKYPGVFRSYVKITLIGDTGETDLDNQNQRSWYRRIKECSPQDLFALSLPYLIVPAVASIILAYMCYPSLKLLLYAAIPKEYQTWVVFGILLLEDSRFIVVLICIGMPVWTVQVISFELVNTKLKLLNNSIRRIPACKRNYGHIYTILQHIQLYVCITNLINSFMIFSFKTVYIAICIVTGYAAVAHFRDYPLFGCMYYLIFLDGAFIYTFVYGRAFKIPDLFEKAIQRALLLVGSNARSLAGKIFKRQIHSIPRMGIKVGDFRMMERESTLIFIHYVLTNIVAMLVANRHG